MKPSLAGEIHWPRRVHTAADAVRFIDAVGYCLLFPIKRLPLPSLYFAVARRQPITWDSHTEKIWRWKDELGLKRRAFYAKYFKSRGTFISLERHGPLATLELRHACKMESKAGNLRFKRAMLELQCLLLVVHFGAQRETSAWPSGRFELTSRAFPRQVSRARGLAPETARAAVAAKYLEWHPGTEPSLLARLFGWPKAQAVAALKSSQAAG